jgi:hypothetical protein
VRGQRRELEEGAPRIEEALDPLAGQELAARRVTFAGLGRAARGGPGADGTELRHQAFHVGAVGLELGVAGAQP